MSSDARSSLVAVRSRASSMVTVTSAGRDGLTLLRVTGTCSSVTQETPSVNTSPPPAVASDEPETPAGPVPDGRRARWAQHREQRREELVDAAIEAIRRLGSDVGMDALAAGAGISKPVLYRYF